MTRMLRGGMILIPMLLEPASAVSRLPETAVVFEDEKEALAECKRSLSGKNPVEQRLKALECMASLNEDREGGPSKAVSEALAKGLQDEDVQVRVAAVEYILGGHRGAAVRILARELDGRAREVTRVEKDVAKLREKLVDAQLDPGAIYERGGGKKLGESIKKQSDLHGQMVEAMQPLVDWNDYTVALIESLAQLPDDRSVRALGNFLGEGGGFHEPERVTRALASFGDRGSWKVCCAFLENRADYLTEQEKEIARLRKQRPERMPKWYKGTKTQWEQRFQDECSRKVEQIQNNMEKAQVQPRQLHEELARLASERGLGEAPAWSDSVHSDWTRWLRKNAEHMPAKLGAIDAEER